MMKIFRKFAFLHFFRIFLHILPAVVFSQAIAQAVYLLPYNWKLHVTRFGPISRQQWLYNEA